MLVKFFFTDPDTKIFEIPDDFIEIINSVYLKKIKYFAFKNHFFLKKNTNNLINYYYYNNFDFFFKQSLKNTDNVLPSIKFLRNPVKFSFLNSASVIFFLKKRKSSFKKIFYCNFKNSKNIFTNLRKTTFFENIIFLKSLLKFLMILKFKFRKKKNFLFSKFSRNRFMFMFSGLIFYKLTPKFLSDTTFDFSFSDFFLKNFFFKNFFSNNSITTENNLFSNNFLNSHFYSCFFNNVKFAGEVNINLTNYTPTVLIGDFLKKKIISKINMSYVPNFYRYVYFGVANLIEFFLKKKIFIKIFSKSQQDSFVIDFVEMLALKNKSMQSRIGRGFFLHEMLDILYTTFFHKDLNFLIKWFVKTMYRINFLNHKKFISIFKQIVTNNSDFFLKKNGIRGFFFDIRGKVGVTGNSKKRHFSFYVGDFSKTSKKYKFDYQFDTVNTYTGALGITMYLCY